MNILQSEIKPEQLDDFFAANAPKMEAWRPEGVVLHNTYVPNLAQFEHILAKPGWFQWLLNLKRGYELKGWKGGPHFFISPTRIYAFTPFWMRGTHSPSWNATTWGVEMIGDFAMEALPPGTRENTTQVIARLYALVGKSPTTANFHFHREDPKTTHKGCPGKNVGPKENWISAIVEAMVRLHPGEHEPGKEEV